MFASNITNVADRNIYIILGSNIGDKKSYIDSACDEISKVIGDISLYSSYYQTSPWGFESSNEFLNRAICVRSSLAPNNVMRTLLDIENRLGRVRNNDVEGYESRTIDLDILLIDNLIVSSELLTVPHPRMADRKFVLVPLAEIAGEIIHPKEKKSIKNLLDICTDDELVTKVF